MKKQIDFTDEIIELRNAAAMYPKYRPKVYTEDEHGKYGPRCKRKETDEYWELYRITTDIINKLPFDLEDGEMANNTGRVVYWAISGKSKDSSWHQTSANVFLEIASKLKELTEDQTPANTERRLTINKKMILKASETSEAMEWSLREWAVFLDCSESGIQKTDAWRSYDPSRAKRDAMRDTAKRDKCFEVLQIR